MSQKPQQPSANGLPRVKKIFAAVVMGAFGRCLPLNWRLTLAASRLGGVTGHGDFKAATASLSILLTEADDRLGRKDDPKTVSKAGKAIGRAVETYNKYTSERGTNASMMHSDVEGIPARFLGAALDVCANLSAPGGQHGSGSLRFWELHVALLRRYASERDAGVSVTPNESARVGRAIGCIVEAYNRHALAGAKLLLGFPPFAAASMLDTCVEATRSNNDAGPRLLGLICELLLEQHSRAVPPAALHLNFFFGMAARRIGHDTDSGLKVTEVGAQSPDAARAMARAMSVRGVGGDEGDCARDELTMEAMKRFPEFVLDASVGPAVRSAYLRRDLTEQVGLRCAMIAGALAGDAVLGAACGLLGAVTSWPDVNGRPTRLLEEASETLKAGVQGAADVLCAILNETAGSAGTDAVRRRRQALELLLDACTVSATFLPSLGRLDVAGGHAIALADDHGAQKLRAIYPQQAWWKSGDEFQTWMLFAV